jgi:sterol 24-C-methyltransferase
MATQDAQQPIIKTYLPKSLTTHLPKTRDDDAWGAQIRSHYSAEENNDKLPTNIEVLEAEREKRKQNYAQIAHECALPYNHRGIQS